MTKFDFETQPNDYQKERKWDKRFLRLCMHISDWSEERGRKVGCVIADTQNIVRSTGYNGLPRGISNLEERNDRTLGEKYLWFEHAERNAIYNAARNGVSLEGCRIYVNLFPCADCTRAIIQSGIKKLVTTKPPQNDVFYARSIAVSLEMLKEYEINVVFVDLTDLGSV